MATSDAVAAIRTFSAYGFAGWVLLAACAAPPAFSPYPAGVTARKPRPLPPSATPASAGALLRSGAERSGIDVLHYEIDLDVRGAAPGGAASGTIRGRALLRVRTARRDPPIPMLPLDFVGLAVDSVRLDGASAVFERGPEVLSIRLPAGEEHGEHAVEVFYQGLPRDGLFLDRLPDGVLTAFADNWPNRARWWFPANDHPSDKATVSFTVRVPAGLAAVANGVLDDSAAGIWRWATRSPIATYTMVIGVAPFERAVVGRAACGLAPAAPQGCVQISIWALPGHGAFGARGFARAADMVDFYSQLVGPFPYEKLAHVQSATRFGGMENASAIFYAREPWSRGATGEETIAHETAHQWFGDAVTEFEWNDLWLSEGFASYFGPLYLEARDGREAFLRLMAAARDQYLHSDVVDLPVVDSVLPQDLFALLNANNYQKGAWVLHMLRGLLGDSTFFSGVRRYYHAFAHGNARTADFQRVMEESSGRDLGWFFMQWLDRPGYPQLAVEWTTRRVESGAEPGTDVEVRVRQRQPAAWPTFRFPLDLVLVGTDGRRERERVEVATRDDSFRLRASGSVDTVEVDPDEWILKTVDVRRRE